MATHGIKAWSNGIEVVSVATPFNHIHSIQITNQGPGTFAYPIPGYNGPGELTMTYGKVSNTETTYSQGGNGKYFVSSYSIVSGILTLTMVGIPDPNTVSDPIHFNFFLRRL